MYFCNCTRSDIAFAVPRAARHMENPKIEHMQMIKRVLRYLAGTIDMGITFSAAKGEFVVGFVDSDFAGDVDARKSTTGFVFLLAGGPIAWKSARQATVSTSTAEAE